MWRAFEGFSSGPGGGDDEGSGRVRAAESTGGGEVVTFSSGGCSGVVAPDCGGSHCLAIFFSMSRIRRRMSRAMRPKAMANTA